MEKRSNCNVLDFARIIATDSSEGMQSICSENELIIAPNCAITNPCPRECKQGDKQEEQVDPGETQRDSEHYKPNGAKD